MFLWWHPFHQLSRDSAKKIRVIAEVAGQGFENLGLYSFSTLITAIPEVAAASSLNSFLRAGLTCKFSIYVGIEMLFLPFQKFLCWHAFHQFPPHPVVLQDFI